MIKGTGRRATVTALFVAGAIGVAIGLVTYATDAFDRLELDSVDTRFAIRGVEDAPSDIVVVEIDDVTFNELQERWPFPCSLHGRLIDRLRAAGAGTIAYDVQFTEPTSPREDNALIRAVARPATSSCRRRRSTRAARATSSGARRCCEASARGRGIRSSNPTREAS